MRTSDDRPCILVVEDEDATRAMLRDLLTDQGYEVVAAENGAAALGALDAMPRAPELVVLDMRMPFIDGPTFVECLRSRPESRRTPVLIVSGTLRGSLPARVQGIRVMRKPFDVAHLLDAVGELLPVPAGTDPRAS